jgi:hypothetical protein
MHERALEKDPVEGTLCKITAVIRHNLQSGAGDEPEAFLTLPF